jgi:hypothetical protein
MQTHAIPLAPQELVAMHALRAFAPEDGDDGLILVSALMGETLQIEGFYGDDLLIQNGGSTHAQ